MLYKVLTIKDYAMTRDVELLNVKTGTKDVCFDCSAMVSNINFDSMILGGIYECKIQLLGKVVFGEDTGAVYCKIIENNVQIGCKYRVKVLIGLDEYYIPAWKDEFSCIDGFYYKYTRKDLIQVDDVVHGDLKHC
ncbi:hypothetical protein SAMN05216390_11373 [Lachnospiraceae bacterium KH1T2]|nr:hypothetical protein SAMN05216390_11373 [Lachnospiraceae bacterium KH1T2]